ncbi:glycoside hydrolase family 2 [Niabella terrae]
MLYLSGTDAAHTRTWNFMVTGGRNSGHWTTIEVPSHWEQQGFGNYNYGRDNVTFGKGFQYASEQGLYQYAFQVPEDWRNRQVNLVFEGVMTDAAVRINGQVAGPVHQGAFYRFSYNITDKLRFGAENLLEVTVSKMSAAPSVNRAERMADYWIFGGIYRPVYLQALPGNHIAWTSIDAKADGNFRLAAHLNRPARGATLEALIQDPDGRQVATIKKVINGADTLIRLSTRVKAPRQWTAETPHLYTVILRLTPKGKTGFVSREKFGFRTIQVRKGDGIYLNGTKIKIKGINRHVFWPDYGRTSFPDADLLDVQLMKDMNLNAVRCSHYPPDANFLRNCDSLGLYVIDELAGWQKAYSTDAGKPLAREMVIRDANHPSIIFWSNGNEGGHNMELVNEYAKYDLSARTVIHAHHRPGHAINGIDCNHYEDYYSTRKILQDSNIYMPTEFLHGLHDGGAAAGLADFWELHWNAQRGAGGFIWNFADEAVVRTDRNGQLDANGYNGTDGVLGPYRQKEGSAYALKEIYAPVKIRLKELPEDFSGSIELENRFHFTNLKACRFHWALLKFDPQSTGHFVADSGEASAPDIAPLQKGRLQLGLPDQWRASDALALTATDPHGREIYRWTWQIKQPIALLSDLFPAEASGKDLLVKEEKASLELSTAQLTLRFDKKTGWLSKLSTQGSRNLSLTQGPVFVSGDAVYSHLEHHRAGDSAVVEVFYRGDLNRVRWVLHKDGRLSLHYRYQLDGDYPFAGVSFTYPEALVTGVKWLGRGPGRVWKNRLQGMHFDIFEKAYNATETGREPWIYPEFKGYYADVVWMELQTMEGRIRMGTPDKDLFVRLFDFYATSGERNLPRLPAGNLSFLDRIPAAGSNLKKGGSTDVSNLGPSSALNSIHQQLERTLYFYFGN